MLPLVILIFASPLVIVAMLTFDQLVIIERERFPEQWKRDGSPATFYRQRDKFKRGLKASFATNRCSLAWLFMTPQWVKEDEKAVGLLRRLRLLVAIWIFGAMPLFALLSMHLKSAESHVTSPTTPLDSIKKETHLEK